LGLLRHVSEGFLGQSFRREGEGMVDRVRKLHVRV